MADIIFGICLSLKTIWEDWLAEVKLVGLFWGRQSVVLGVASTMTDWGMICY